MKLESKFDLGEEVYFWSIRDVEISKGTIEVIDLMRDAENSFSTYAIKPFINDDRIRMIEHVPEHLIFRKREDVFDFCMALTNGI